MREDSTDHAIISVSLKDKNGNLWFAASGRGIYRYDGACFSHFTMKEGLISNTVSCIYEDKTGKLWLGTDSGVCCYDGKSFSRFSIPETDSDSARSSRNYYFKNAPSVTGILQDKAGNFWFATLRNGVYRYDGKLFTGFLTDEILVCIAEDQNGNIWVGSWRHGGAYRFDGKSFNHLNGLSDDMIKCIYADKAGNIWIGTRDHGADRYDGKSIVNFSEKEGLCNTDVTCIFEDQNGNIWFGSDAVWGNRGDACRYDGKTFTNITAKENRTGKGDQAYSVMTIVEDKNGAFWFGSRGGLLLRYDGKCFTDFTGKVS